MRAHTKVPDDSIEAKAAGIAALYFPNDLVRRRKAEVWLAISEDPASSDTDRRAALAEIDRLLSQIVPPPDARLSGPAVDVCHLRLVALATGIKALTREAHELACNPTTTVRGLSAVETDLARALGGVLAAITKGGGRQ